MPKSCPKSTPWGTFRPGPQSTPVNGGRDRNAIWSPAVQWETGAHTMAVVIRSRNFAAESLAPTPVLYGCGFFAYSWKLPAFCGAFLLTVDNFSSFAYSWSSFAYSFSFSAYSWSFFAYNEKVRLIRALRHCKQRSLTVSKKAPTVSKKASPVLYPVLPPWAKTFQTGAGGGGSDWPGYFIFNYGAGKGT